MATMRDRLLEQPHYDDTARLWYNEDATKREGKMMLRLTEEYLAQDTFQALLDDGWEPVRADSVKVMQDFQFWIEARHNDVPDRDQLRREWFDFLKQQ